MGFTFLLAIPGGGGFCPGKLTLGKILPGKNSVPELKKGVKILSPRGLEGQKGNSAQRRRNFWLIFFVDDSMKLNFP